MYKMYLVCEMTKEMNCLCSWLVSLTREVFRVEIRFVGLVVLYISGILIG